MRSRTFMERRKNLSSNKPIEPTISSKEVSIKPYYAINLYYYHFSYAKDGITLW
jgi:hypothetical protein